ncbi:unnamed protein product [Ectocarpus sp. 13 AM-2016]
MCIRSCSTGRCKYPRPIVGCPRPGHAKYSLWAPTAQTRDIVEPRAAHWPLIPMGGPSGVNSVSQGQPTGRRRCTNHVAGFAPLKTCDLHYVSYEALSPPLRGEMRVAQVCPSHRRVRRCRNHLQSKYFRNVQRVHRTSPWRAGGLSAYIFLIAVCGPFLVGAWVPTLVFQPPPPPPPPPDLAQEGGDGTHRHARKQQRHGASAAREARRQEPRRRRHRVGATQGCHGDRVRSPGHGMHRFHGRGGLPAAETKPVQDEDA